MIHCFVGSRASHLVPRLLFAVAVLAAILSFMSLSESDASSSGVCGDNVTWSLDDSGNLTVTGNGPMYDYGKGNAPWYGVSSTVKTIDVKSGVTSVGSYAFAGCALNTIVLPSTVTYVGEGAFQGCQVLMAASMPLVTEIGSGLFIDCTLLMSANMPQVQSIPENTFYGCVSLMSVNFPFINSIGGYAFSGCLSLSSVVIPSSVSEIGKSAFYGCFSLASISVSSDNQYYSSIDGVLFNKLASELIKYPAGKGGSYTIPSTVTSLAGGAFTGRITLLEIPESVKYIDPEAFDVAFYNFDGKSMLDISAGSLSGHAYTGTELGYVLAVDSNTRFTIDGLVYSIKSVSPVEAALCGYSGSVKNVSVPAEVSYLGISMPVCSVSASAFKGCTTITTLDLGDVSVVDTKAFANCKNLKTVVGGPNLKTVGPYAFYKCSGLNTIDFTESSYSLGTIRQYAFNGCNAIHHLSIPSNVVTLSQNSFTIKFYDENRKPISVNVSNLAGYFFEYGYGSNGYGLLRQANAVGSEFTSGTLTYKVTSSLPFEVAVIGHSSGIRVVDVMDSVRYGERDYNVTSVADEAFSGCTTLKYADLRGVETIGKKAFYGCSDLRDVIMEDVTSIGTKAFAQCVKMDCVEFGESLKTIGSYAFYGSSSLETVEFPDSVTTISAYAFGKCPSLTEVVFGEGLKTVGKSAFGGIQFLDMNGNVLSQSADDLVGNIFRGSDGVLQLYSDDCFTVHFRVGSDSIGFGFISEPIDVVVRKGTTAAVNGNVITLSYNGKQVAIDTATPISTETYTRTFALWNNVTDDMSSDLVTSILEETWYYAHFDERGKPVQVEVKYVSEGLPIVIDGKNLDWVTASYFGNDISVNYRQNFSADVAKKLDDAYTLKKGYVVIPNLPTNQGATVVLKNVQTDTVVIQFEFDKNVTYIQRHMYGIGDFPVTAMPEAYGLDARVTVTATDPADIGKTAKVLITDNARGEGTYIGVGQTGTYHGHSYTVIKGDSGRADDVKVLIDGEINVCSQTNPLPFWYQFV